MADKAKRQEYNATYRARHPGRVKASRAAYEARYPERIQKRRAAHFATHSEEIRAKGRTRRAAYMTTHRDEDNARNRTRRAAPHVKAKNKATHDVYYEKNGDKLRAYGITYRLEHIEEVTLREAAHRKANPEIYQAKAQRRRALHAAAPVNDFTAAQWKMMKQHYGYCCVYCGKKFKRLTMDHITPLCEGGSHTMSNILPACQSCNSRKGKRAVLVPVQPLLL